MERLAEFMDQCRRSDVDLFKNDDESFRWCSENTMGLKQPFLGLITPKNTDQLRRALRMAHEFQIRIHPVSTGCNWGFGSKLAPDGASVILDLRALQDIRDYDPTFGTITLGPGVTQRQLGEYLRAHHSDYYLDVTGSSADSSVLGNTLERGIAYNSLRKDGVIRFEAMTMDGRDFHTGFGRWQDSPIKNLIDLAPGLNTTQLLMQTNFVIVTSMTFQLLRHPESEVFFNLNFSREELPGVVDVFGEMKRKYDWEAIIHIANRGRSQEMLLRLLESRGHQLGLNEGTVFRAKAQFEKQLPFEWTAIGSIKGPRVLTSEIRRQLQQRLRSHGQFLCWKAQHLHWARKIFQFFGGYRWTLGMDLVEAFSGLSQGRATNAPLQMFFSSHHSHGLDHPLASQWVDASETGFIYSVPLAPLVGSHGLRMVEMSEQILGDLGFKPEVTLNAISANILEAVVSVSFNKKDSLLCDRAQQGIKKLTEHFMAEGYIPYRFPQGIKSSLKLDDLTAALEDHLKRFFDPQGLISPGKNGRAFNEKG